MSQRHGGHGTLTYGRWKSMRQRCNDTAHPNHANYGGRGIAVCARWDRYAAFLADMGDCPDQDHTLDRLDNERGYEPGNCRWVPKAEQSAHRRTNIQLTHAGVTQIATAWAAAIGIPANSLLQRLRLGWSVERALMQPLKARAPSKGRKKSHDDN